MDTSQITAAINLAVQRQESADLQRDYRDWRQVETALRFALDKLNQIPEPAAVAEDFGKQQYRALRDQYVAATGKQPFRGWNLAELQARIDAHKTA